MREKEHIPSVLKQGKDENHMAKGLEGEESFWEENRSGQIERDQEK